MLSLRRELIEKRVHERFGGSSARIAEAWPGNPPNRSTLHRWLRGDTMPRSSRQLLGLAGALDVDPFSLWSFDAANFESLCARVAAIARWGSWPLLHSLAFVADFIGPLEPWPPASIATNYYERPWFIRDVQHPARIRNYYAALAIGGPGMAAFADPQVWHFAYRDAGRRRAGWRPYGFVEVAEGIIRLFDYAGVTQMARLDSQERFFVETWFGEGAADFRIASLHGFTLSIVDQGGKPSVRFGLPAPAQEDR